MSRKHEIAQRMQALRSEGAWAAAQLPRDFDRARDWREHVRAHPIPAVLAAAAVGFTIVPARGRSGSETPSRVVAESRDDRAAGGDARAAKADSRSSGLSYYAKPVVAALSSWAGRIAIASATGALQRLATENFQSLPSSLTKHGSAPSQRRGDTTEQRRVYTD